VPHLPGRLRLALVLGGLSAFGPLTIDMYLPALPRMADALDTSAATVQLTLSAFMVGLALGQLVVGPLSDAWGRRRPLVAGLVVYVVGSLACAFAPTVELLVAARVVEAFGAAAGIVIARAVVRDLFSGTAMTKFFSLMMLVNGLAPVLAPVVGAQLLRATSWRGVFVVLTCFGVLLLVAVTMALPDTLPPARRTTGRLGANLRTYRGLLGDRSFMAYAVSSGLMFAAMFAYISGSTFVLQDVHGLSPQQFSLVFGVNSLGIIALGQLNGVLVGRVAERTLLQVGLVVAALGGVVVLVVTVLDLPLWTLLVGLFLVVPNVGLVSPNATSLALADHGATAGSASALLGLMQFVFGGLAAPLVGIAGAGTAVPMGIVMCTSTALALVVFAVLARPADPGSVDLGTGPDTLIA
jgi:DHA1 family bicyclomycin/chloramphenicol resistance-like MFS transporter